MNKEERIKNTLLRLGITLNSKGYDYLVQALCNYPLYNGKIELMYADMCKKYNIKRTTLINAMIYAIEKCFKNKNNRDYLQQVFGNSLMHSKERPHLKLFIIKVLEYLDVPENAKDVDITAEYKNVLDAIISSLDSCKNNYKKVYDFCRLYCKTFDMYTEE